MSITALYNNSLTGYSKNGLAVYLDKVFIEDYHLIKSITIQKIEDISNYPNFYQLINITTINLLNGCEPLHEFSKFKKLRKIKTPNDSEYILSQDKNVFISILRKKTIIPEDTLFLNIGKCYSLNKIDNLPPNLEYLRLTIYIGHLMNNNNKFFTNLPSTLKKFELQIRGWRIFIEEMNKEQMDEYVNCHIINNMKLPLECIFEYDCICTY